MGKVSPNEPSGALEGLGSPFDDHLGIRLVDVTPDRITAEVDLDATIHHQPWGSVHGGLYCTLVETLSTIGTALAAVPQGKAPAGLENHTSFVRMVSSGRIFAEAMPLHKGRQQHLWQVRVTDAEGRLLARGTCRLMLVEPKPAGAQRA